MIIPANRMFTNLLVRKLPQTTSQQVRYVRKTFKFRYAYGEPPLVGEDEYQAAKEDESRFNDLEFKKIRFVKPFENSSHLFDRDLDKFTSYVMKDGRRDLAEDLMHETFYHIKMYQLSRLRKRLARGEKEEKKFLEEEEEVIETNPMTILKRAIHNSEPVVITKKVKRGGATYQVPYPITAKQSEWFAIKWLINAVRERPKRRVKLFPEVMAQELIDAAYGRGKVIKKRDDIHRLADANKAYAHYRWG